MREINVLKRQIQNQLDSMDEMGELESLWLQMAMDRLSKLHAFKPPKESIRNQRWDHAEHQIAGDDSKYTASICPINIPLYQPALQCLLLALRRHPNRHLQCPVLSDKPRYSGHR